mgnify:CR=1 FL=1
MPLHPQAQKVLEALVKGVPPLSTLTAVELRETMKRLRGQPKPIAPVYRVEERRIPADGEEIVVRIYTPDAAPPLPALMYFHGGGWCTGDLDSVDNVCRLICNGVPSIVVSVDYRLAPEHRFPTAVDDAYAALRWMDAASEALGADPTRISVGGDSAGATLAAVAAVRARDRGGPRVASQVLVYPVVNFDYETESFRRNGKDYFLTVERMEFFRKHYLRSEADAEHPEAAPLYTKDFRNLPPALLVAAEYDPLTDGVRMYAEKLRQAGNRVETVEYSGMIHGFFTMPHAMDAAAEAIGAVCRFLRRRRT